MVVRLTLRMERHDRLRRRRVAARWRPVRDAAGFKAGPCAARAVVGPVNDDIAAILRRMRPRWQRYRDSLHLIVELQEELSSEVVLNEAVAVALLREGHKLVSEAANLPAHDDCLHLEECNSGEVPAMTVCLTPLQMPRCESLEWFWLYVTISPTVLASTAPL